jgi:hypothetical protein
MKQGTSRHLSSPGQVIYLQPSLPTARAMTSNPPIPRAPFLLQTAIKQGPTEHPPGIDGPHLSDTKNFIRGLHGEYLISWGQKSDLKVANAIFGEDD